MEVDVEEDEEVQVGDIMNQMDVFPTCCCCFC